MPEHEVKDRASVALRVNGRALALRARLEVRHA